MSSQCDDGSPRPNVVFFMVDQLSARWFDAARSGACPTPNFEKLCESGVTFTNAITSNPVCCPARATLATGLTTRGHGVLENGYLLDPSLPTFMRALQQAGWRTGALGKVHFRPHFAGLYPDCKPYGFDVTYITEDSRGGQWLDWVQTEHPEHFEAALATIWPSKIPEFEQYGPNKVNLRERIEKIRSEFQWATDEFPRSNAGQYTLPYPAEVSQTEWITARAVDFIRQTPADKPLYAHVSYVQPHSPFCPPAEYMHRVNLDKIPDAARPEWLKDRNAPEYFADKKPQKADWRIRRWYYFADIAHLDHQLGRVMEALEAAGRMDNTCIIFLSDHGELLGDHGFAGKEERHYDACIRVPLVIAGPGLQQGKVCDELVQLEDICPTVLDMTGQRLPAMPKMGPYLHVSAEDIPVLPGGSLLPLCRGDTPADWRAAAYCESYNGIWSANPMDWARTIRTKKYRYTVYPCGGGEQLFDLTGDPDEQRNVCVAPARAKVRRDLRDQLLEMIVMQDYPKTRRELFALGVH